MSGYTPPYGSVPLPGMSSAPPMQPQQGLPPYHMPSAPPATAPQYQVPAYAGGAYAAAQYGAPSPYPPQAYQQYGTPPQAMAAPPQYHAAPPPVPGGLPMQFGQSDIAPPIYNPQIPYVGPIPPLVEGVHFILQGYVPPRSERFYVNLSMGEGLNEEVTTALQINPRFGNSRQIVRNTYIGGWGDEERKGPIFPFNQGQGFEMIILTEADQFKIAINGKHYCDFKHRLPIQHISHLVIGGDVTISCIRMPAIIRKQPPPIQAQPQIPQCAPPPPRIIPTPYMALLQGAMYNGRLITVSGIIGDKPKAISITLGYHSKPKSDLPLHIKIYPESRKVVRNTMAGTAWGKEENQAPNGYPFAGPGSTFTITIKCTESCYRIEVNGKHFVDYRHRLKNLKATQFLFVDGDLKLTDIKLE